MSVIIFLIILSVLVVAHEAGHFFAAKRVGVEVQEFGLGFPPRIKKLFHWRGTDFSLNWLLFGGFVRMKEEGERNIFVLFSGVLANFLLAWLLFSIVLILGVESQDGFIQRGLLGRVWHVVLTTGKLTWFTLTAVIHLNVAEVVGPVGLVGIVGQVASSGLVYLLYFTAIISINLGIINLVPLPALDGGRILIVLIEKMRQRRLSLRTFNILNLTSFALLIFLMIVITVRDIGHLL